MTTECGTIGAPETVPLQNAVLCVDCELITTSRCDVCPVCGGHALLSINSIIGGALIDYREQRFRKRQRVLFDLHVEIDIAQMEASEMSAVIHGVSRVIAPKLGTKGASLHMNVNPVRVTPNLELKAA